jgi:hypothetical protein
MSSGEEKAWHMLAGMDPAEVERNASVRYEKETSCYVIESLGMEFSVFPGDRAIRGSGPEAEAVRKRYAYFLNLSVLCYLVGAKDIGLTGRLLKPENLKGGHHFFRGTHELPLKGLAGKYGAHGEAFLSRARHLGGKAVGFGDASVELYPLPRVPVTLILWFGDEEFPARADLLFDSSVELQAPLDIAWSVAMLSALVMLLPGA